MNRKQQRRARLTEKQCEFEGYQQIGRAVCALLRETPAYAPYKEVRARRFGLRLTSALMKPLAQDGHGAHLLVEASFRLWKYRPLAAIVTDDDDIPL